jgi:[acyl-carrier-protein] S-malonyltransferase
MRLIFMFPSQSSHDPGMIARPIALHPPCRELLDEASDILGRDLAALYLGGDASVLEDNRVVQLGVFLASRMFQRIAEDAGLRADASLGCSLGEYSHVVHIGALGFADALPLLERHGELYEEGPDGDRVALFPLERPVLEEALAAEGGGEVEIAGDMTPHVVLIGGPTEPTHRVVDWLEARLPDLRSRWLRYRKPIHCSAFRPVGERLAEVLADVPFATPRLPYCPNSLGRQVPDATPQTFVELLARRTYEPVLWRQSIDALVAGDEPVRCLEVGPGTILTRYQTLDTQWHPDVEAISLDHLLANDPRPADEVLQSLGER